MKTIVISSEEFFKDEALMINSLFDAGLSCFHLRKSDDDIFKTEKLINEISTKNYNKIFLHGHLELVDNYGLRGFHLSEFTRQKLSFSEREFIINSVNNRNYLLSTSFHKIEDLRLEELPLHHAFLSPIYNSISKKNYKAVNFKYPLKRDEINFELYALGGVSDLNIKETIYKGFHGIALLGYIWRDPSKSLCNYLKVKELCQKTDLSY